MVRGLRQKLGAVEIARMKPQSFGEEPSIQRRKGARLGSPEECPRGTPSGRQRGEEVRADSPKSRGSDFNCL